MVESVHAPPPAPSSPPVGAGSTGPEGAAVGGRRRRTRTRRHTRRGQTAVVAVLAVAAAVVAAGLGVWGFDTIADSRVGREVAAGGGRPVAVLPSTPVALLAQAGSSGGLVAVTLLALAPSGAGGFVILVPPGTLAEVPGLGQATLAQAWGTGGATGLTAAVEALFQVHVERSEVMDERRWRELTEPLAPFDVDFGAPVRVPGPDGQVTTLVPAGGAPVQADDVARILEARAPSESELARLVRHEELWRALLAQAAAAGAEPLPVATTAPPGRVGGGAEPAGEVEPPPLAAVLGGLAAGQVQVRTIETTRQTVGAAAETYEADVDALRLLAAQAMPGAVSPSGDGWRVRLVNSTGDVGALQDAARRLLHAGFVLVIASDSLDGAPERTQVRFDERQGRQAGDDLVSVLGRGEVDVADERIEGVDVTVILGRDYQPASDAGTGETGESNEANEEASG